ncbi:MAG: response regulator [Butyricicoccus sp.]|nr:response regulator [Butyricicoccus sp.]MCM1232977.1 response regulator [Ruminococcus flavefaciens]
MSQDRKRLLIVDDSDIDRIMLKSILCKEFEILEAGSGNAAFNYVTNKDLQIDGMLLDITMPNIDGFDVLKFMADKEVDNFPVFLVTAEPTRENVERAIRYKISDFIGKPFNREDVLRRVRSKLGLIPDFDMSAEDMKATEAYISELEILYNQYLTNFNKDKKHYQVMVDLMNILLTNYSKTLRDSKLTPESIRLISKAAYFCDIGEMLIPDRRLQTLLTNTETQDLHHTHPSLGASLIRLNRDKSCEYFVEVCSSMCLHHHERYDGGGYPDGLLEENNSIYNQMCRMADEFEKMRSKFYGDKSKPVKFVIRRMVNDNPGMVMPVLYYLLEDCEQQIIDYFMKIDT